jgi:hypothetical protein
MSENYDLPPFEERFNNLELHITKLNFEKFNSITSDDFLNYKTPYSRIFVDIKDYPEIDYKILVGKVLLMLKSHGDKHTSILSLNTTLSVKAIGDIATAESFCTLIKYLFELTTEYVDKTNITDANGERFVVPTFPYSKEFFQSRFPELH